MWPNFFLNNFFFGSSKELGSSSASKAPFKRRLMMMMMMMMMANQTFGVNGCCWETCWESFIGTSIPWSWWPFGRRDLSSNNSLFSCGWREWYYHIWEFIIARPTILQSTCWLGVYIYLSFSFSHLTSLHLPWETKKKIQYQMHYFLTLLKYIFSTWICPL